MKKKLILLVVILLLLGGSYLVWGLLKEEKHETMVVLSRTFVIERGNMKEIFWADGSVTADRVEVRTFLAGEVAMIYGKEGEKIEENEVILTLKRDDFLSRLQKAEEEVEKARDDLARAQIEKKLNEIERENQIRIAGENLARATRTLEIIQESPHLKEKMIEANEALKQAQVIYNMATGLDKVWEKEIQLKDALANRQEKERDLENTAILARTSGIITSLLVEIGDRIGSETRVATITSYHPIKVTTKIDEFDLYSIQEGQRAHIIPDALPRERFEGYVASIAPEATRDGGLVVFETTILVENPREILRPGMTVSVELITAKREEVLKVPTAAIEYREGAPYVILKKDDQEVPQRVFTGLNDGTYTEILRGLEEGDTVVMNLREIPDMIERTGQRSTIPTIPGMSRMGR